MPYRITLSRYTGRWWVGCYIWYSEEKTGRGCGPVQSPPCCTKCNSPPINGQRPVYQSLYCCIMVHCSAVLMCRKRLKTQSLKVQSNRRWLCPYILQYFHSIKSWKYRETQGHSRDGRNVHSANVKQLRYILASITRFSTSHHYSSQWFYFHR